MMGSNTIKARAITPPRNLETSFELYDYGVDEFDDY